MKPYSSKANAKRAARNQITDIEKPIEGTDFEIIDMEDGKFGWRRVQAAPKAPAAEAQATKLAPAPKAESVNGKTEEQVATEKGLEKVLVQTKGDKTVHKGPRRKGAVREVWDICDDNKELKRKDVIAICVAKGINFYTARTQYQAWKQASDNSK